MSTFYTYRSPFNPQRGILQKKVLYRALFSLYSFGVIPVVRLK